MIATLRIPGRLPALNDLMLDRGMRVRVKKQWCKVVASLVAAHRIPKFPCGAKVHIECVEPNKRRDPDGFCGGAAKVVLDALKLSGVLNGDGWSNVLGLSYSWRADPADPCVVVTLEGVENVPRANPTVENRQKRTGASSGTRRRTARNGLCRKSTADGVVLHGPK